MIGNHDFESMMMMLIVVEVDGISRFGEGGGPIFDSLCVCYDIVHQYDKNELRPRECHFIPIPILKEICI